VADLDRSGLPLARYADEHRLSAKTLAWWRWALKAGPHAHYRGPRRTASRAKGPGSPMSFVPVRVIAGPVAAPTGGALRVVLAGGRRIEVGAGFDGETLGRLIRVLEAMPC
jgi:hypothetical protein